jgi:hypothetical protein
VIIKPSTNVDVNHTTTELQNMINEKTNEIEKLQSKKDKTPADEVAL